MIKRFKVIRGDGFVIHIEDEIPFFRELIQEICKVNEVEIVRGHVSKDHVQMFVSVPPKLLTNSRV